MPAYPLAPATAAFTLPLTCINIQDSRMFMRGSRLPHLVEEARAGAGVAGRAVRAHPQQHGVEVAVQAELEHLHEIARRGPLLPEPPRSGVKPGPAGLPGPLPRLRVHVREHEHFAGRIVLDHRGHKALREVRDGRTRLAHCRTSTPLPARSSLPDSIDSSPKWKIDAASAASAPPAVSASYMWVALPAPPEAMTGSRTAAETAEVRSRS